MFKVQPRPFFHSTINDEKYATHLIVGVSSILVDSINLSDLGTDRLSFKYSLLFSFSEQRNLVVHVF